MTNNMIEAKKVCRACELEKDRIFFMKRTDQIGKYYHSCIECLNIKNKKRYKSKIGRRNENYNERIKRRLNKYSRLNELTGCIEWISVLNRGGYGIMTTKFSGIRRTMHTHRVSYLVYTGKIEDEMHICHRCDNRKCINPDHLFMGTRSDNMIDMLRKGRANTIEGELHPKAKLNLMEVNEIRASILSINQLAQKYQVSRGCISLILREVNWKRSAS